MSILEKLKKNSTIKGSSIIEKSMYFNDVEMVSTPIPILNIALSAKVDGGLSPGICQWVGESKRFKSTFCLLMAKSYLDKYSDSVLLFYDSEFGTPPQYFLKMGLDMSRVFHTPITNVEELKFDIMNQLENVDRGEKLFIIIDSIGNLASKREYENALAEKSSADLSRPAQLNSLFRIITPHLRKKNIPLHLVNHSYKSMDLFPKDIVSGGQKSYLSANDIFIIGRQQEKDGTELSGYNFIVNVEKSRSVKEKSKFPVNISFQTGINKWSGLLEVSLDIGAVVSPNKGWYSKVNLENGEVEEKKYRSRETNTKEFWEPILSNEIFKQKVYDRYSLSSKELLSDEAIQEEFDATDEMDE